MHMKICFLFPEVLGNRIPLHFTHLPCAVLTNPFGSVAKTCFVILRWQVNMRDTVEWFFACTVLKIYKYVPTRIYIHMYFEVKKCASDMFGVTSGLKCFASNVTSLECTWCRGRNQLVMCLWSFRVRTVLCSSVKLRVLRLTAGVLFSCLAGWFHSLSCCTATRTQSGSGYPAGKWHQGESEVTSLAHCR